MKEKDPSGVDSIWSSRHEAIAGRKNSMKAAVCEAFGVPLVLSEVPVPSPGPAEILIRVSACGVCHSDLHLIDGEWRQ